VSPDGIAFPVPANDDAARAIRLYCEAIAIAATRGGQEQQRRTGADIGAMVEPPKEEAIAEPVVEASADTTPTAADADIAAELAAEGERQIDA
jgi:small subunit ribosomal protein S2